MQAERQQDPSGLLASGARVRNAYATYPSLGDSPGKPGLIPRSIMESHGFMIIDLLVRDGHASD